MRAIQQGIAVISMHTNMDNARGGVNWRIADKLGLKGVEFMSPKLVNGVETGSGVVGQLAEPMAADDFIIAVKKAFGVELPKKVAFEDIEDVASFIIERIIKPQLGK